MSMNGKKCNKGKIGITERDYLRISREFRVKFTRD